MLAGDDVEEAGSVWQPPTEDEIRNRAYEIHLERQRECGGPLDDWLEAEGRTPVKAEKGAEGRLSRSSIVGTDLTCREERRRQYEPQAISWNECGSIRGISGGR